MKRNYLPITVAVLVLGVVMSVIPQTVELRQPDELVTSFNKTVITKELIEGITEFVIKTGSIEIVDGFDPSLILSNSADREMNATVVNLDQPENHLISNNESSSLQVYYLEQAGSYDLQIAGQVYIDEPVEVTAVVVYYRATPPEQYTYYPYRFFGLGMASVGIVATIIAKYYHERTR